MVRTARSTATQAMTLEWVKCRRGPRTSQMPSSGCSQWSATNSTSAACRSQAESLSALPAPHASYRAREDLAVHVQLELARGGVAHPHRGRALVARQPVDLPFGRDAAHRRART